MKTIHLGCDRETDRPFEIPVDAFRTHVHMPGATGKGKSTAIMTMLQQLLLDWRTPACHVVVDFLGGLTNDLLMWMSSRYCTQQVRDRLVLLRPSDNRYSMTLNPLLYDDEEQGFFKVNRATELILRAWTAQSLADQPRLARWLFNAFWACAKLGLTVADTEHLLLPGSKYLAAMLDALPDRLRGEWYEVLMAQGGEAVRILDSTRNRMKPFHDSGILRRMFGSVRNRLDAKTFMQTGKILVLDLSPGGRLSPPEANAIAGLVVNEFLAAARSLPRHIRFPTYLWLDEFQRLVSPDLEYAIPEMRQLGIRLILAHQSFSQLKTDEADLTSLIWQPQTRLAFGESGDDADLLAAEYASLTYDPKWVKEELQETQDDRWRAVCTQSPNWQHLLHWTLVSDLHILFDQAVARAPNVRMCEWFGEWSVCNPDEKLPHRRYTLYTMLSESPRLVCIPDAGFLLEKDGFRKVFYLEADRDTTQTAERVAARKSGGFAALAEQYLHIRKHFPTANVEKFAVLVVAPTIKRRDALRRAFANKPAKELYRFAVASELVPQSMLTENVWQTSTGEAVALLKGAAS